MAHEADRARAPGRRPDGRELKGEAARAAICEAVIACLDAVGYAETTISRVVDLAGVSRGALTHHFPSKEDLIVATTDRLLTRPVQARLPSERTTGNPGAEGAGFEQDFLWLWDRMVNTPEGRAFLEILMATRTDEALRIKIQDRLLYWDRAMNDHFASLYRLSAQGHDAGGDLGGAEQDARVIWSICRVFLRGLINQDRFEGDPASEGRIAQDLAQVFARLIAPYLTRREPDGTAGPVRSADGEIEMGGEIEV